MDDGMGAVIRDLQTLFDGGVHGIGTDAQLLDRFVAGGDEGAFEAIVRRHGWMVWAVCRRILRDRHDAEDAFQATFLVLARRADRVVPRDRLGNWLHGVARRTALKAGTARARRRGRERPLPVMTAAERTRERPPDEWLAQLDRELGRLPEKYRAPIVLCELEGRTHRQAAEQLGWPIGTLSGRLSRARALLARRLSRGGLTLSIGSLTATFAREASSACVSASVLASTIGAVTPRAVGPAPAADLISPRVAALAEGVIRMMMLSHLRSVVISVVLAFSLCGIAGAVVQLGRDGEGSGRSEQAAAVASRTPAAGQFKGSPKADETAAPIEARSVLARKGYGAAVEALKQTQRHGDILVVIGRPEEVYRWSIRWLETERDISRKRSDHVAALEAHLKRMTELDKLAERLNRELLPNLAKLEAEWYVLEARLWLEQANAK